MCKRDSSYFANGRTTPVAIAIQTTMTDRQTDRQTTMQVRYVLTFSAIFMVFSSPFPSNLLTEFFSKKKPHP